MALSVVTRGYKVGSVNLVVTRGYTPSIAALPTGRITAYLLADQIETWMPGTQISGQLLADQIEGELIQ